MIEPVTFARAARTAAQKRQQTGGTNIDAPDEATVRVKLDEVCDTLREAVRCQLIWRYRDTLPGHLAPQTREQKATEWFDERWNDAEWRVSAVPGKHILKQLRRWCQDTYGLTLTDKLLLESMDPVPLDLQESLSAVSNLLYSTAI